MHNNEQTIGIVVQINVACLELKTIRMVTN